MKKLMFGDNLTATLNIENVWQSENESLASVLNAWSEGEWKTISVADGDPRHVLFQRALEVMGATGFGDDEEVTEDVPFEVEY